MVVRGHLTGLSGALVLCLGGKLLDRLAQTALRKLHFTGRSGPQHLSPAPA